MAQKNVRADHGKGHRTAYEKNRKKIFATQKICALCGKPVDFKARYPHPLSPCVDHIIPIAKGGHPSDLDNLQLAHWFCNRQKSDKLFANTQKVEAEEEISNRDLPQSINWASYRSE